MGENELRVVKLTDRDDIEAYLTTFERLMATYSVSRAKWIFKLAPQLTGKTQQAYAALTTEVALSYDAVKAAILRRYDITEETYRAAVRSNEESHRDLSIRLGDLANKWLRGQWWIQELGGGGGEVAGGAAPGRVREGGTPPAQLGGVWSVVSSPIGVWGSAPEANAFCVENPPKST